MAASAGRHTAGHRSCNPQAAATQDKPKQHNERSSARRAQKRRRRPLILPPFVSTPACLSLLPHSEPVPPVCPRLSVCPSILCAIWFSYLFLSYPSPQAALVPHLAGAVLAAVALHTQCGASPSALARFLPPACKRLCLPVFAPPPPPWCRQRAAGSTPTACSSCRRCGETLMHLVRWTRLAG